MANNKEIAQNVLAAVGGSANIKSATHCMTRLRLYLKDDTIPQDDQVKAIKGVLGVVRGGQQYQIVIGTNVDKVYDELIALAGLKASAPVKDDQAAAEDVKVIKKKLTFKQAGKNVLGYTAGCMTPMIPVLLGGGLCNAFNAIFADMLGLYSAQSNLYILLNFVYDAALYFMPILAGYSAAKQLDVNGMLGAFIGCILMSPDFAAIASAGTPFDVYGIPCTVTTYSQTVLPVMLSVPVFCLIYKIIKKYMPDVITTVFTPFLSILISLPFILCLLAPLGTIVGNLISNGLAWFGMNTGFFGVALGAALRMRSKDERSEAFGAFASGILGGVTEPTLYGICFQHTRCFIGLIAGGFAGGAIAGMFDLKGYVMTSANFLSVLGYVGGTDTNLIVGIVASVMSLVVAAVVTFFFGFPRKELEKS